MKNDDYQDAYNEGYEAGLKYHMDGYFNSNDNPYYSEDILWEAWNQGFDQAGLDS